MPQSAEKSKVRWIIRGIPKGPKNKILNRHLAENGKTLHEKENNDQARVMMDASATPKKVNRISFSVLRLLFHLALFFILCAWYLF